MSASHSGRSPVSPSPYPLTLLPRAFRVRSPDLSEEHADPHEPARLVVERFNAIWDCARNPVADTFNAATSAAHEALRRLRAIRPRWVAAAVDAGASHRDVEGWFDAAEHAVRCYGLELLMALAVLPLRHPPNASKKKLESRLRELEARRKEMMAGGIDNPLVTREDVLSYAQKLAERAIGPLRRVADLMAVRMERRAGNTDRPRHRTPHARKREVMQRVAKLRADYVCWKEVTRIIAAEFPPGLKENTLRKYHGRESR